MRKQERGGTPMFRSLHMKVALIMLLLIAATSLFSTDDKDNTNEGGGLW